MIRFDDSEVRGGAHEVTRCPSGLQVGSTQTVKQLGLCRRTCWQAACPSPCWARAARARGPGCRCRCRGCYHPHHLRGGKPRWGWGSPLVAVSMASCPPHPRAHLDPVPDWRSEGAVGPGTWSPWVGWDDGWDDGMMDGWMGWDDHSIQGLDRAWQELAGAHAL